MLYTKENNRPQYDSPLYTTRTDKDYSSPLYDSEEYSTQLYDDKFAYESPLYVQDPTSSPLYEKGTVPVQNFITYTGLNFLGSGYRQYAATSTSNVDSVSSSGAMAVWFYPRSSGYLFGIRNTVTQLDAVNIFIKDTNTLSGTVANNTVGFYTKNSTANVSLNELHLAVLNIESYSGAATHLFLDGVEVPSTEEFALNLPEHGFGSLNSPALDSLCLNGIILEAVAWNTALSPAQITALYNNGIPTGDMSLVNTAAVLHHYKLDEGTGTTVADSGVGNVNLDTGNAIWTTYKLPI